MASWTCWSCGHPNVSEDRFCRICGKPKLANQKNTPDRGEQEDILADSYSEEEKRTLGRPEATGG